VITDLNQNLPALLESAHIANPVLSARITAAVNLILTTVNSFAALMPQASTSPSTSQKARAKTLPRAKDLKRQWNQQLRARETPRWTQPLHIPCCAKRTSLAVGRWSPVVGPRSLIASPL
jgi:hypothetical protein